MQPIWVYASTFSVLSSLRFRTDVVSLPGQSVVRASAAVEVGLGGVVPNDLVGSDLAHEGERVWEVSGGAGRKEDAKKKHANSANAGSKSRAALLGGRGVVPGIGFDLILTSAIAATR